MHLPGRRRLASAQAHDHIANPYSFAWLQRDVARNAVALVEQSEHGHPLRHRCGAGEDRFHRLRNVDRFGLGLALAVALRRLTVAATAIAVASCKREQDKEGEAGPWPQADHAPSGVQAS
ncbi:MAG TPA: hypothetical protein VEZ70_02425 [Allosphingosinicella sp.]|nr:hypothetical protein [Allosphingosinicella sp.]